LVGTFERFNSFYVWTRVKPLFWVEPGARTARGLGHVL
jgi:hypothetical protein